MSVGLYITLEQKLEFNHCIYHDLSKNIIACSKILLFNQMYIY